ncbi:MAG: MarR family transcriptional regulator [Proteobacteria bacterium]|nr:MarR family transcriptional regulator [Pseudomonadota bacterium]
MQTDHLPHAEPAAAPPFEVERSVGFQMRRITLLLGGEIDRRMEPLGLTDAQWKPLLRLLLGTPGTSAALARDCHMDAGGLTRLIDRLQAKGLCQRERSQQDRRTVHIALTPEGRVAAEQLPVILAELQQQLLQGFSPQEEARLRSYLARIYANTRHLAERR